MCITVFIRECMAATTCSISAEGRVRSMAKCKNCTNLYNLSDDNDVIVGKWCPKVNDSPDTENERDCENYKCMTQGDHIRSMSDEEIAEIIMCPYDTAGKPIEIMPCTKDGIQEFVTPESCKKCIIEWLHSEVEEQK